MEVEVEVEVVVEVGVGEDVNVVEVEAEAGVEVEVEAVMEVAHLKNSFEEHNVLRADVPTGGRGRVIWRPAE